MFYFLSLLAGALISVSVLFNGALSEQHGVYFAPVIIHITGLIIISLIVMIARIRPFAEKQKWWLYMGGVIGFITVISNNIAFGRISVSAILAISLLGQTMVGLVIDQYGWLSTPKHLFNKWRIVGLILTLAGIAVMMEGTFDLLAVTVSFIAGLGIIIARTLNGRLADLTDIRTSTFFNYLTGLLTAILIFLFFLFVEGEGVYITAISFSPEVFMYMGGAAGVCLVLILNFTVTKVPAFYLSLLLFIGQVFTGIVIDTIRDGSLSVRILIGGILVTLGLCTDLYLAKVKGTSKKGSIHENS